MFVHDSRALIRAAPCWMSLQLTCSADKTQVTVALYADAQCSLSPRLIITIPADKRTCTHLMAFGISMIANCDGPTSWPDRVMGLYYSRNADAMLVPYTPPGGSMCTPDSYDTNCW
jgi:hypothetical protein